MSVSVGPLLKIGGETTKLAAQGAERRFHQLIRQMIAYLHLTAHFIPMWCFPENAITIGAHYMTHPPAVSVLIITRIRCVEGLGLL